jgi:hypothetical protein
MDAPERAAELVSIIECNVGEPDAIARALAPVYRQAEAAKDECREILWYMIKAAFNSSAAHSLALEEYLAAIEQGREPSEEAVAKFASQEHPAEPKPEVIHGSSVLLTGSDGTQLFRLDFADAGQYVKTIEFHVLDHGGRSIRSFVVGAKSVDPKM